MNKLCAFICLVAAFTGSNHLVSQTFTFNASADLTSTGVTIVDSSSATESIGISDLTNSSIVAVLFSANISSSSSTINSDGTINNTGGSPFNNELVLSLVSPSGTSLELISAGTFNVGGNEDAVELLDINFANGGALQGSDPTGGTYAPTGGSFDIFDGELAGGALQIVNEDAVKADPKSLNGLSLTLVTTVSEPFSPFFMALGRIGVATLRRRTAGC